MKRKEPTPLDGLTYGMSSSWTSPHVSDYEDRTKKPKNENYEVFLSFRGKDTRKGFTDHLYTRLVNAGVHVFRDANELRVGEEIGMELLSSMKQSKISIPIISKNYAFSKWCLRELVQMLKCKTSRGHIVLPIFYKVEPSQVRHLTGKFGKAINAHKENFSKKVVKEWEKALKKVSSLKGWESEGINDGHEGALVTMVVRKVMSELKRFFQLNVPKQLVGIDDHVEQIMSWIGTESNNPMIIGIYGMGGIGKTTLAKVLYNKLSSHFENLSFLENIRETSQHKGIKCLQKQLIYDIIGSFCDVSYIDEGIGIIKSNFTNKKMLILLDDMDDDTHLNALVGDGNWLEAGSIIIITTRKKRILHKARAGYMYPLKELCIDQSLILFSRHAFGRDSPPSDYEVISSDVVSTTGGLPLALEVIGSLLCGQKEEVWKDTSEKLEKVPEKKVQEKLRISYDALDYENQQIFLDIACFFIGSRKQNLTYMWDACGFFPRKGIEELSLMSLIKINEDGKLMMHDQLRDLGREIVRLENKKKPQKRSRLWIYEEAADVLDNNKGTNKIEALRLVKDDHKRSYTGEHFKELTDLRFLQMSSANLTGDFQNLLPQLRGLEWQDCPSDFTVINFHPEKLVMLNLSRSKISESWRGWVPLKMAIRLKVLNLSHCDNLGSTPDLSTFESMEILILEECRNLEEIHPSIRDIKTLVSLNVRKCDRLKKLPSGVGRMEKLRELLLDFSAIQEIPISRGCSMKLETLRAPGCEGLAQLPKSMGFLVSLTQLDLSGSSIKKLPKSIGSLKSLTQLDLSETRLKELPKSMSSLVSLTQLDVSNSRIKELPKSIHSLKKLKTLHAVKCASLVHIPGSIGHLTSLSLLDLSHCNELAQIPDSIGSLESLTQLILSHSGIKELPESVGSLKQLKTLDASHCALLTHIPSSICHLTSLSLLDLSFCTKLDRLPDSIGSLISLQHLLLPGCQSLREIPETIEKLTSLTKLDLESTAIMELPENIGNLQNLRILDIHRTHITKLPGTIGMLAKLQELSASHCKNLEGLPSNIGELVSLKTLGLCKSGISGLPESISKLSSLQYLDVRFCEKLQELPELPFGFTALGLTDQSQSLLHLAQLNILKKLNSFLLPLA